MEYAEDRQSDFDRCKSYPQGPRTTTKEIYGYAANSRFLGHPTIQWSKHCRSHYNLFLQRLVAGVQRVITLYDTNAAVSDKVHALDDVMIQAAFWLTSKKPRTAKGGEGRNNVAGGRLHQKHLLRRTDEVC